MRNGLKLGFCKEFFGFGQIDHEAKHKMGEGMYSYLQMAKAMAAIFLALALLNSPVYLLYYQNSEWTKGLTLGSLGETSYGCELAKLGIAQYTQECKCVSYKLLFYFFSRIREKWFALLFKSKRNPKILRIKS